MSTTYSRPGVFINEVDLPQAVTLADSGSAIGALVGALKKGPATSPVLLTSWTNFVKTFGGLEDAYPTTWAAYNFFANGGRQLYVKRVLGSSGAVATVSLTDRATQALNTLRVSAANNGAWGNTLSTEIKAAGSAGRFSLVVYGDGTELNILEQFSFY